MRKCVYFIFVLLFPVVCGLFFFSTKIFAGSGGGCAISVGGVPLSSTLNSTPVSPTNVASNGDAVFPVTFCGSVAQTIQSGDNVMAAINGYGNFIWDDTNGVLKYNPFSQCFEGTIQAKVSTPWGFIVQIQTLADKQHLCDQVVVNLQGGANQQAWDTAKNDLCSSFAMTPTNNITTNSTIVVHGTFPSLFTSFNGINTQAIDPQGVIQVFSTALYLDGNPVQSIPNAGSTFTYTEKPGSLGTGNYSVHIFEKKNGTGVASDFCPPITFRMGDPSFCQQCGPSQQCASGLTCSSGMCIGSFGVSGATQPCLVTSDCSNGLTCSTQSDQNFDLGKWCANYLATNPNGGVTRPGTCSTPPPQEVLYTCSNRGGQCSSPGFSAGANLHCIDGQTQTQCDSTPSTSHCWINPYDATGVNTHDYDKGSCIYISPQQTGTCGLINQTCCSGLVGGSNAVPCRSGKPIYTTSGCTCTGVDTGGSCSADSDCSSQKCGANGMCMMASTQCEKIDNSPTAQALCQNGSGTYCSFTQTIAGNDFQENYCCPTQPMCDGLKNAQSKPGTNTTPVSNFDLCSQANPVDQPACNACKDTYKDSNDNSTGVWTSVGCIDPSSPQSIIGSLLTLGLGLSGGVVLLSILAGAFMFATSAGESKRVQEAREMITAAIIGLLFIIFSVIILQFVGVNILHIPGFGTLQPFNFGVQPIN